MDSSRLGFCRPSIATSCVVFWLDAVFAGHDAVFGMKPRVRVHVGMRHGQGMVSGGCSVDGVLVRGGSPPTRCRQRGHGTGSFSSRWDRGGEASAWGRGGLVPGHAPASALPQFRFSEIETGAGSLGRPAASGGKPATGGRGSLCFSVPSVFSSGDFDDPPRVFKIEQRTARLGRTGALVRPRTKAPVRVGGRGNLLDDVGMAWRGGAGLRSANNRRE